MTAADEVAARIERGEWKATMREHAHAALRPGMATVEGGSGFGIITAVIAQLTGAPVLSFEPHPAMCNQARVTLSEVDPHGTCAVRWGALIVGPTAHVELQEVPGEPWRSTVRAGSSPVPFIPAYDLDDAVRQVGASALVLDVEGAEYRLLTGSRLDGVEVILVELHGAEDESQQLAANLEARGFTRRARSERSEWDNVTEWWERQ